jgi:two-component system osmolarity sensor histidine kinase EnvZ
MPGFWVSFDIDGDKYWLMLERDRLAGLTRVQWLGWATWWARCRCWARP